MEDSLAKKRARDRRAQQNQRDKRNQQVRSLQEQLTRMESRMLQLSRKCQVLHEENNQLRARQDFVKQLVASWSPTSTRPSPGTETCEDAEPGSSEDLSPIIVAKTSLELPLADLEFWSQLEWSSITGTCGTSSSISTPVELPPALSARPWTKIPAHLTSDMIVTESFKDWLQRPDLVLSSPEQPQPTELLYGSKCNFLANVINQSLRSWPCRDPEHLAAGWLVYNQIKWMLYPSPGNYGRLQEFQAPVSKQLEHGHPYFIDFIHWPELRARMIQHRHVYDPQDVLGMYLCCVKLRWPWGQNFLEPEEDGKLRMRQDFFNTFTSLGGWGLTDDFFQSFPVLAQGLDLSPMRYRVC